MEFTFVLGTKIVLILP